MAPEALITPLEHVPLFHGLEPRQLTRIAQVAERIVYKPGDVIIRGGSVGDAAILVVSGQSARTEGPMQLTGEELIEPHTLIGEMAMLVETEHSSTVVARSQVRALKLTRIAVYELMAQDFSIAEHFIDKLSTRLLHLAGELRGVERLLEVAARLPGLEAVRSGATATTGSTTALQ